MSHRRGIKRYLPSLRGWFSVVVVPFAYFWIPTFFPVRIAGGFSRPMPTGDWIKVALILGCCAFACVFGFIRGRLPDKVIAILAGLVTLWMIVMCIRVAII